LDVHIDMLIGASCTAIVDVAYSGARKCISYCTWNLTDQTVSPKEKLLTFVMELCMQKCLSIPKLRTRSMKILKLILCNNNIDIGVSVFILGTGMASRP